MPYAPVLADRIRGILAGTDGLTEKRMLGGVGWMIWVLSTLPGIALAVPTQEGPDAMGPVVDIEVVWNRNGDLDERDKPQREDGQRYEYETRERTMRGTATVGACIVDNRLQVHTASRSFCEKTEAESFWQDPQEACGPLDPNARVRMGRGVEQKVVKPGDSEKTTRKRESVLYTGNDVPPQSDLANILFIAAPNGHYRLIATYRGWTRSEAETVTTHRDACKNEEKVDRTVEHTLDSLTAPGSNNASPGMMVMFHPPLRRDEAFHHEGVLDNGRDAGSDLPVSEEEHDGYKESVTGRFSIEPRDICKQVLDKMTFEVVGAEAYSNEDIRDQARSTADYERLVSRQMWRLLNGEEPDKCFPSCVYPSPCGTGDSALHSVSNELEVSDATCAIDPAMLAAWEDQQKRSCTPRIIRDATLAHEDVHSTQCDLDHDRFANPTPASKGQAETSAWVLGALHYKSWLERFCPDHAAHTASLSRRLDAVIAKDNGW